MLLQIDGSDREWQEGHGPHLTLISAIDGATSEVPHAPPQEQEDATSAQFLAAVKGRFSKLTAASDDASLLQRWSSSA